MHDLTTIQRMNAEATVSRVMYRVRMNGRPVQQFPTADQAHRLAESLEENYPDRRVTVRAEEAAA